MTTSQLIRITSWNVAGQEPSNGQMLDYLFDDSNRTKIIRPDIQIVGLQEAPQYLFSDPWTNNLSNTLKPRGYILFKRHKLSGILLYIFVLREIMLRARDFETESVKTGFGGFLGNKGGVSLRFTLNGNSISVTNSHLAAHQENLPQRIDDFESIMENTKYRLDLNTTSILTHDYSFWFGDLNFRFDGIEKFEVLNAITKAKTLATQEDKIKALSKLYDADQLTRVKKEGKAFSDFHENPPQFMPTYKFQIGSKDFYDSENRIPAWTDRILFRNHTHAYKLNTLSFEPKLEQLFYDSIPETQLSDHKPVVSMFKISTFDPAKFNPSHLPFEVIKFEIITGWRADKDSRLWYKISNELFYMRPKILSSWDRLALYRSDFVSLEDYLTLAFANNLARVAPRLDAQEVAYESNDQSGSPLVSRRGSTVTVAAEAISLNYTTSPASTSQIPRTTSSSTTIDDGYKYFSVGFSDDVLVPGKFVILYLKTNPAGEYNVLGISDQFEVAS